MENASPFAIGKLSRLTGVHIETIRYYEKAGLMPDPPRTEGGHRSYTEDHLKRLTFIRRSRELGLTVGEIEQLLGLVDQHNYSCGEVQALTLRHAENARRKIVDLTRLETTLRGIAAQCSGNDVPDCPIIDGLLEPGTA